MMNVKARSRLRLTAVFLFGLAVTAATLAALGHIGEAGEFTSSSVARSREAPALTPLARVHSLFLARHYAEAYGRYASLADAGDPVAASMALTMVMHGPALFGSDWSATSGQLQRWNALARQFAGLREGSIAANDGTE
jgi:hypothetical protein